MPCYHDNVDLNQKQLVMVSTTTAFFKRSFAGGFIMAEWFHSEDLVEILTLVLEL